MPVIQVNSMIKSAPEVAEYGAQKLPGGVPSNTEKVTEDSHMIEILVRSFQAIINLDLVVANQQNSESALPILGGKFKLKNGRLENINLEISQL